MGFPGVGSQKATEAAPSASGGSGELSVAIHGKERGERSSTHGRRSPQEDMTRSIAGRAAFGAVIVATLLVIGWILGGCTETPALTQELVIDEPLGATAITDVHIEMGAGRLAIEPGASGLASGVISYNIGSWKPKITRTDRSLTIKQNARKDVGGPLSRLVNDWDLQLGRAPLRLKITAGAYEGEYDLSGLTLQRLTLKDGAAQTRVSFNTPNPGQMESLEYETGASSVTLIGLANANFKTMTLDGKAGDYSLDFSGQLRTDATVKIKAAAGRVRVAVPGTTPARVTVKGSLNKVSTEGAWTVQGDAYDTTAVETTGKGNMLRISVEMDIGSVTLAAD